MSAANISSLSKMLRAFMLFTLISFSLSLIKASPVPITTPTANPTHQSKDDNIEIVKYSNENIDVNGYNFAFETSDGVSRREMATVKNAGSISVEGTVSWTGPDGIQYTLNYLADEHGFQPQGTHLPVAPESAT
ncbi:endocuticle structural protein SgAbd-6-like [Eurosta solidaginis]|uniref:endocuticle structural protein SgAbd-6-like n=1 Tax=Eurosta solidaginis TaxID=178769 RepID=UPI003530ADC9